MNRSSKGCWTCRIRHRKCDESHPICQECSERRIQCHGYGPRPEWIDDQESLQAELVQIKRVVKQNFRRRRRRPKVRPEESEPSPETLNNGHTAALPHTPSTHVSAPVPTQYGLSFREAQLIVHYLDYIFPIIYPYYTDNPEVGGRGWLFWLLMKNGPLHQAILTLSALHQYTKFDYQTGNTERELIEYHTRALQGLRQALHEHGASGFAHNREQLVEFLACGAALISFEIFLGGTTNWRPHVDAVIVVVNQMSPGTLKQLPDGMPQAQKFLVANMVWVDILACTSTGEGPKTAYREWLQTEIDMQCMNGCENWVMIAIGDLGALNGKGISWTSPAQPPPEVLELQRRLEGGLMSCESPRMEMTLSRVLTRIFAAATLVELCAISPPGSALAAQLSQSVDRVIAAVKMMPHGKSQRGLTWPFTLAGSMANPEQQVFFEDTMAQILGSSGPGFSNCDTVARIMKQCWYHRDTYPGEIWNWRDAMRSMGICALLV